MCFVLTCVVFVPLLYEKVKKNSYLRYTLTNYSVILVFCGSNFGNLNSMSIFVNQILAKLEGVLYILSLCFFCSILYILIKTAFLLHQFVAACYFTKMKHRSCIKQQDTS